jgi:hypothetical protein
MQTDPVIRKIALTYILVRHTDHVKSPFGR